MRLVSGRGCERTCSMMTQDTCESLELSIRHESDLKRTGVPEKETQLAALCVSGYRCTARPLDTLRPPTRSYEPATSSACASPARAVRRASCAGGRRQWSLSRRPSRSRDGPFFSTHFQAFFFFGSVGPRTSSATANASPSPPAGASPTRDLDPERVR